jgi:ATP-dependent Clp protease ATP-binding subunit ClpA
VRARVVEVLGEGTEAREGEMPFTPASKEALEVGLREALALRHDYIGTEHVLLALLRQGDGLAATILHDAGLEYESTREAVLAALGQAEEPEPRFEYRVIELVEPFEQSVAGLADEAGWELVAIAGEPPVRHAVLKRRF